MMEQERADTVPGFTMQSENFYLKFITGLQCGVSSRLLEYETDWYEVMEIILSRLQDEQEDKERFEVIASRDLEYWAKMQPGGDSLNLKIRVMLEEKRYFESPAGFRDHGHACHPFLTRNSYWLYGYSNQETTCHHLRGGGAEGRGGVQRGVLVLTVLHQLEGEPVLGLDTLPGGVTLHQSQVRTGVT